MFDFSYSTIVLESWDTRTILFWLVAPDFY